ncbi:4985_t:CDS:2, partial [Entrophospora sp. SA101]
EIKAAYNEKKVPDTRSWGEVGKIRDNKIKTLFKQYFQGNKPVEGLNDNAIDFKINYQGIAGIEVSKINKKDIDAEIAKVDALVKQINTYQYLRDLDANQASIDKQFQELKTNLLPPTKPQAVSEAIQKQRSKLYYSLTDPKDGGIEEATLKQLAANLQNT